jgi:phosphatidate cytidylyltransferase
MSPRLWDIGNAFSSPLVLNMTLTVAVLLVIAPIIIFALSKSGKIKPAKTDELYKRTLSWFFLCILIFFPILTGPVLTILAVSVLSYLCFHEFARATGLFRERAISLVVIIGIAFFTFAALDHWYNFFNALAILTTGLIAAIATLADRPSGYIQRVALGCFALIFFGYALGHLGYMANDLNYRPIILMVLLTTELNDIFAYITGHLFGKRKMAKVTSPNKTLEGAIGALLLTTLLVTWLGGYVFKGTELDHWYMLLPLGLMIGSLGQLGDLMMSSIKRDLGVKDIGQSIPGHGGVLDRFDSLLLVAPAVFHYVGYYIGFGLDQPIRIFTGGGG